MPKTTRTIAALVLLACAAAGAAPSTDAPMSREDYEAAVRTIEAQAKSELQACKAHPGRAGELCATASRGRAKVAEAELEAKYRPSPEATQHARNAKAEAEHALARQKCSGQEGAAKDRCVKAAKGAREAAIRLAKVEKVQAVRAMEREAAAQHRASLAQARP